MATIQTRTTKDGVESHRVDFYKEGELKWIPSMEGPDGAETIKHLVET